MDTIKTNVCSHADILALDGSTAYTLTSNAVMQNVITNPNIATAVRLWFHIRYEQSGFLDREFIVRTVGQLSDMLKVTRTTIQKWQKTLIHEGYLEVIYTKKADGQNLPNKYRACLPKSLASILKRTAKQREKIETDVIYEREEQPSVQQKEAGEGIDKTELKTLESNTDNKVYTMYTFKENPELIKRLSEGSTPSFVTQALIVSKVTVQGDLATIYTTNGFIRDHVKHSNVIRSLLQTFFDNTDLQVSAEIDSIQQHENNDQETLAVKSKTISVSKTQSKPIQRHIIFRIKERLESMKSMSVTQITSLLSEIVYSITKGSLSSLSHHHAINTALKLVKENRWSTPGGYVNTGLQIQ